MKIAVDLGHGNQTQGNLGGDGGAVGLIAEETIINEVGGLLITKLKSLGHTVIEVRPTSAKNVSDSLYQRTTKADNNNVDFYISLHANAGCGVGTEVFTYGGKQVPQAVSILNNIVSLGFKSRGIKDGSNLYVVKNTKATSILVEICFVDTQSDVDKYNSIGAENIANAILKGLTGGTITTPTKEEKVYIVTQYLPKDKDGYLDINYVLSYFKDVKCYFKSDDKGIWICTDWITKSKAEELKSTLGSWYYDTRK